MKNKEPKKKWTGKKQIWYGAAGLFCLVAAVLILILGNGMGAQAEPLHMGDKTLDFTLDSTDHYYEIKNSAQLSALGNATADQTKDKNFKLVKDLKISSITAASTGTFAGTFDGKGYVITIEKLGISDATPGTSSQGVLFGTVTGTVRNVIVNITDDEATYKRTSDAGVTSSEQTPVERVVSGGKTLDQPPKPYVSSDLVSELDTKNEYRTAYNQIKNYKDTVDGTGKELEWQVISETVTTKTPNSAGEDSFGIICGELSGSGTVEQVLVDGKDLTVTQEGTEHKDQVVTTTTTTTESVFYKKEENYKFNGLNNIEVSLPTPAFYEKDVSETGTNAEVGQRFSITASAPVYEVAAYSENEYKYSITYDVTVTSLNDLQHTVQVTPALSSTTGGTWNQSNATLTTDVTTKKATTTFIYKGPCTADSTTVKAHFKASEMVGEQTVTATTSDLATTVNKQAEVSSTDSIPAVGTNELQVTVTGRDEIGTAESSLSYTVTVKNNSGATLKDVKLNYEGTEWTVADSSGSTNPISVGTLNADVSKEYTFTRTDSFSVGTNPSLSVSASGTKVTGNGEQKLVTGNATKTTEVKKSPDGTPSTVTSYGKVNGTTGNVLQVTIEGQKEAVTGTKAGSLTYTATITNLTEQAMSNLVLNWYGPLMERTGTLPPGATETKGMITVKSLEAGASITISFTNASALTKGNDPLLSITATANLLNSTSGTSEDGTTPGGTITSTPVKTDACTKTTNVLASIASTPSTVEAGNTAILSGNLSLKVTAPKYTAKNTAVIYTIEVRSKKAQTVTLSTPDIFLNGTWYDGNTALSGAPTITFTESGTKTYTYQVTPTASAGDLVNAWNLTAATSENAETLSLSVPEVSVYNNGKKGTSPVTNKTIAANELQFTVSAPAVAAASNGTAEIVYRLANVPKGTVLTAFPSGGTWKQGSQTSTDAAFTASGSEEVSYTLSVSELPSGTKHRTVKTSFTASQTKIATTLYAATKELSTDIYAENAMLKGESQTTNGELKATVTTQAWTTSDSTEYTLTLQNTITGKRIYIEAISDDWTLKTGTWDKGSYTSIKDNAPLGTLKGKILADNAAVVLKKSIAKNSVNGQKVTLSGIQTIREADAYRYTKRKTKNPPSEDSKNNPSILVANSLSVGMIAGKSNGGKIQEISGQLNLKAVAATGLASNGASLRAGGIVGHAEKTELHDLYVRGSVSGGNYLLGTGSVENLQHVIVTGTSDVANLGVSNPGDTVLAGMAAEPADGWEKWKRYSYYQSESDQAGGFDLGWLVKKDAFSITPPVTNAQTVVQTKIKDAASGRNYSYYMAYSARREQTDQDHQIYYCTEPNLNLGSSGYYKIIKLYATDGYYHYLKEEDTSYSYPFMTDNQKPQFFEAGGWKVVRKNKTSLEDEIQLTIFDNVKDLTLYYYNEKQSGWTESSAETIEGKTVKTFPFQTAEVSIRTLPQYEQKFYEEETKKFAVTDHLPLPAPGVQVSDFYQEGGKENIVDFKNGNIYGNQAKMSLTEENTKCSYQYYIAKEEIKENWRAGQSMQNALGYVMDLGSFSSVEWTDITSGFQMPENAGTWYLYLKVSADGYAPIVYQYGSFQTAPAATAEITVYLDDGTKLEENDRVASGDRFRFAFTMTESEALGMTHLQYLTSVSSLTGDNLHMADEWKAYTDTPVTINRPAGADEYYIYARINNGNGKYQEIKTYHYTFEDAAGTVTISPRTVSVESIEDTSAASTISSSAPIYLNAQEEGARILYLISDRLEDKFSFTRVTENLSGLTDGENGYFKVGSRWYRTDENVQVYTDSISLYNDRSSTKAQYIHTAVLGSGGEPGETITYAYQVSPMGQTPAPEATMDTLHFPGGEDKDSTKVQKGASLSFQSLTSGAELYYIIGDGSTEVLDHEEGETRRYDDKNGIEVTGDYGNQFVIRMKAVKWSTDGTGRKELKDSETVRFIYTIADQEQTVAPTATPSTSDQEPTVIRPGDKILLSTPTKAASIYYTADGSVPSVTKSEDGTFAPEGSTLLYDAGQGIMAPPSGNGYFTVRAIAVHPELANSPEAKYTYSFPSDVGIPYANIPSGDVDMGTAVILKNKTEGAEIYYTVSRDGTTPEDPTISSSVFDATQPIIINGATVIKAIAVKDGVKSGILTLTYNSREQLSAPTASIDSGAMVSRGTRLKLKAADRASIYYTMDGSDPSDQSNASVISGSELILDGAAGSTVTVKACARKDGKSVSEVVTFTYQISQSAGGVTADVPNGTLVSIGSKINLMTDVTDAEIRYTTDGSSPADNGIKGTVVTVDGTSGSSFMIKAVAVVDGDAGTVCTFTYKIKEKPSAPTASPSGGTLTVATRVELNSSAEKIYYTTDGVTPTEGSSLYKEPILINKTTNLKAIAVSADGEVSEVASFQYTAALKAEKPTASHDTGTVLEPGTVVALHTDTSGAEIYYSTDGTEPTRDNLDSMTLYTEDGITVNRTVTILAAAYREDMQLSAVTELYYQVDTIPAVEQKKAEEALLEEQQLKDTDSSGLTRTEEQQQSTSYQSRVLRERDCNTVVSSTWESIPSDAVLVTEKQEYGQEALANVRQLFGDDYTIISSYNMYLMRGSTIAQPQGEVEIGMPIPEAYENAAVTIVYIDKNNKITKKETRRQDGMAYAKTDHFSHYALVGLEEVASDGWTVSYLLILEAAAAVTVIAGLGYYISRKWKKMKRDR
ncbi:FN3 associated domain-containing protein [Hominiventricola filiformis]|uniref:Chitobiase/beta-hexosaminidase C-terminal domain-containing protein n=1 Tax=Hominiventricola filiformis TaxID=2885352 RepID=A0AAE3A765_9FIRM|nr:FN3 associated domain-containing protein [Hominiventricola filiformis]MCC2125714.1 chitobiase/beta-hexosaminidase C-terminal domain-containing protein [Hominiventricola filiformis]